MLCADKKPRLNIVSKDNPDTKEQKRKKVLQLLRKERSTLSMQHVLCIGLLNQVGSLKILQPSKHSVVTEQYVKVQEVEYEGFSVDVGNFFNKRCQEMFQNDIKQGISEKTAKRRIQNNRKIDEIHFYQDILQLNGYTFDCLPTSGKPGTYKFNVIKRIYKDKRIVMTEKQVQMCCLELHTYLSELLKKVSVCQLEKNERIVQEIVKRHCLF